MAQELRSVDVTDNPDIRQLAEAVAESGVPLQLETHGEQLAVLHPMPRPTRARRDRPVTRDDSLFDLIGIGESGGDGSGSERKHEILADAYRPAD